MRKLNLRLIVVLLICGLVGAGGVYVLHRFQVRRLAQRLLREARIAEANKLFEEAARNVERSLRLKRSQFQPYVSLAEMLRWRLGRAEEADYWIGRLVTSNPDSHRAYLLRGRYSLRLGRIEEAETDAGRALELAPDDCAGLLLVARCAASKGQYKRARQHAARAVELYPRSADAYLTLTGVELRAGNRQEAVTWLREGLKLTVGDQELLASLVTVLVEEGEVWEAQEMVNTLKAEPRSAPLAGYLQAKIDYARGRWLQASRGFEQARSQLRLEPELARQMEYSLADCYGQMGDFRRQLAAYQRAAEIAPSWVPARLGIAATLLSAGRVDEALPELRQLVRAPNAPTAWWVQLVRALIIKNARLAPSERDWQEVESALKYAGQTDSESVQVAILRADVLVAQNRLQEAAKLLQDAQTKNPQSAKLWIARAALADGQRDFEQAADLLDEAQRQLGDSAALRLARASHLVRRRGDNTAESLRTLSDNTTQLSRAELLELWRGLAWMSFNLGDDEHASQLARRVAEREPDNLRIHLLMLDLAVRAKDVLGMTPILREIERIQGKGPLWHYGRALSSCLLANEGLNRKEMLAQAQEHLAEARQLRPEWPRVPTLAAEIDLLQGDQDRAIEEYLQAIDLGERNPEAIRRVIGLLHQQQRYREADRIIRRLEAEQSPYLAYFARMASDLSLRLHDVDRALEIARRVADDSNDYRDHLWLAQILEGVGLRARSDARADDSESALGEAEEILRHAVELAHTAPETWAALAGFLVRTGQTDKVQSVIAELQHKVPVESAPRVLARCYEVIGKPEEAQKQCEAALAASPKDPAVVAWAAEAFVRMGNQPEAEKQLRRIIAGGVQAKEEVVLWARRRLASILAARGGYPNLQQALDLVDRNLAAAGSSADDQRVKGILLASHPQRTRRLEAIRILQTVLQGRFSPAPEDRFVLARLYMAEGEWSKAARQLKPLVDLPETEPRYVAAYVETLSNQGDLAKAESWLKRLEQVASGQFSSALLRAEVLLRRDEFDRAIDVLKRYLDNPSSQPADRVVRLELVASFLLETARALKGTDQDQLAAKLIGEAEAMRRESVAHHPEQEILIAAILSQQGRDEEALALAEKAWKKADPVTIARAAAALQASGAASPDRLQRIETILLGALEDHQRATPLLLGLANLRVFQGRYKEAEALLREVMGGNDGNVVALNNLAVLLALQETQLDEARRLIEKAIERAGPVSHLLDSRATVYMALGKPSEALADLEAAIAEDANPTSYFHKAQVHYNAGQQEAAAEALAKADDLGLTLSRLNPLERPAYEKLRAALR